GDYASAKASAAWFADVFGRDRFFLEVMDHGLAEQRRVDEGLLQLQRELGLPLVATNDTHYLEQSHAAVQDVLICVQTGKRLDDPGRMQFETDQCYLKGPQEMQRLFGHLEGALANSLAIAERC